MGLIILHFFPKRNIFLWLERLFSGSQVELVFGVFAAAVGIHGVDFNGDLSFVFRLSLNCTLF